MKDYHVHGQTRRTKRWPIIAGMLFVLLLGGGVAAVLIVRNTYTTNLKPVSASTTDVPVVIASGASLDSIANSLKDKNLIRNVWAFKQYVRTQELGDKLQAGTYKINAAMSVQDITNIFVSGKVAVDLFTILPNQRLDQVKASFLKAGFSQTSIDAAFEPTQYETSPALVDKPKGASLEGYLYPESFQRTADTSPKTIIQAALGEMATHLTPDVRAAFGKRGLSTYQAITLASIIEREVPSQADRAIVAQVFLKRIGMNMPLQSDATYVYGAALLKKDPSPSLESPYNTYLRTGLTPTPISNVTASSLQAVANPAATDYLYFVSGDDGTTHFAKTNEEHLNNVKSYCKKLCG